MLLHVLPTLFRPEHLSQDVGSFEEIISIRYPLGSLFAGLSFLLLFAVDRLFLSKNHPHHHHHEISLSDLPGDERENPCDSIIVEIKNENTLEDSASRKDTGLKPLKAQAFVFVLALSLHSFLEGLGLSAIKREPELLSFVISLLSHKWLEAFALGATVLNAKFSKNVTFLLNLFYSTLTPIGKEMK